MAEKGQNTKILNEEGTNFASVDTDGSLQVNTRSGPVGGPQVGQGGSISAFSLMKVAQERPLFDYRYTEALIQSSFLNTTVGSGNFQLVNNTLLRLNSGAATSSSISLESRRRHIYRSGVGQIGKFSIILGDNGVAGNIREWGMYDDQNGYFIRLNGTSYEYVRRNNGVETVTPTSNWNVPVTPDAFGHLWYIQFQWLGVGKIYIYYDEQLVHVDDFLGTSTDASVLDPDLPIRFNNENTTNATDVFLQSNCASVSQEGSQATEVVGPNGNVVSVSPDNELEVKTPALSLFSDQFYGVLLDTNLWNQTLVGSGSVAVSGSQVDLGTTTLSGDSSEILSKQFFGQIFTKTNTLKMVVSYDEASLLNNKREWGVKNTTTNDAYFFRLEDGVLSAVVSDAGVETVVNIDVLKPIANEFNRYDIIYKANFVEFLVDKQTAHKVEEQKQPLTENQTFFVFLKNENTGVTTAPASLFSEGLSLFDDSSSSVQVSGQDDTGVSRVVAVSTSRRLLVSQEPPTPPPATTPIIVVQKGDIAGTVDNFTLITNGTTLTIQRVTGGAETSNSGTIVELFEDPNGDGTVLNPIEDIYVNGSSGQKDLNANFIGDGTRRILLRRRQFGGGTNEVTGRWEGFET